MSQLNSSQSVIRIYYLGTVVFLLLDVVLNINVRIAFLDNSPALRAAYYAAIFACMALILWRPGWTVIVTAVESLVKRRLDRKAIAIVSQVLVDRDDPAFKNPTKPIGPQLDEATAKARAKQLGWVVKEDVGRGWRRVVPSPAPVQLKKEKPQLTFLIL